jgi:hypothetical protein
VRLLTFCTTLQFFFQLSVSCALAAFYYDIIPSSFAAVKYAVYFLCVISCILSPYYSFVIFAIATAGFHYGIIPESTSYAAVMLYADWLILFVHVYRYIRSSKGEDDERSRFRKEM